MGRNETVPNKDCVCLHTYIYIYTFKITVLFCEGMSPVILLRRVWALQSLFHKHTDKVIRR